MIGTNVPYCFELTQSTYTERIRKIAFTGSSLSGNQKIFAPINPFTFGQLLNSMAVKLPLRYGDGVCDDADAGDDIKPLYAGDGVEVAKNVFLAH